MKCDQVCVLTVLILATFSFKIGVSIVCYQCNSAYDPRCGDPFDPYSLGTVNCIYSKRRVVRGCGYITEERDDCYRRTGTFDVDSTYCACKGDICNGSPSLGQSTSLVVTSLLAAVVLLAQNRLL
ncbi:hypothetical protein M8J75_015006 [Diaphorina citri]|nr:hypothetical protein M8J75_015006 [Diaphorina citri]